MYRAKFRSLLGRVNWRSVVASYNESNPHNPFAWAEAKLPDLLGEEAADLLKDLYYESTWLGYASGKAQIERGAQKAPNTDIDWGGWTPGDPLAAQKLIGTKDMPGLKQLLDKRFITMKGIEDSRYTELGNMLANGLSLGESTNVTAKLIADRFDKPTGWADVVARTETRAAVTAATRDSYAEGQIEMIEWLTADGGCDICGGFEDMGPVPIDEGFDGLDGPPAHPNCLCVLIPVVGESAVVIPTDETDDDTGVGEVDAQAPDQELTIEDRIAAIQAEREPGRLQLVGSDAGTVELTREEYDALIKKDSEYYRELQGLWKEQLEAKTAPTVQPSEAGIQAYTDLKPVTSTYEYDTKVALQDWQGDQYKEIQRSLNGDRPLSRIDPEVRETIKSIDKGMEPLPSGTVLYRGQTEGLDGLTHDQTFKVNSYTATSTDPNTAGAFSKSSGQVLGGLKEGEVTTIMRIDASAAQGVVVPGSSEYEIILARGSTFTVTGMTQETINGVTFNVVDVVAK